MKKNEIDQITNGTIIRFKNEEIGRDWVCISIENTDLNNFPKHKKNIKNNLPFYIFGGLWYDGNILTSDPYGKTRGNLKIGVLPEIEIVGHISNKDHETQYRTTERIN